LERRKNGFYMPCSKGAGLSELCISLPDNVVLSTNFTRRGIIAPRELMAKKQSTDEIIRSWPEWKQTAFTELWKHDWRIGSNKRATAEAFDRWANKENVAHILESGRSYTQSMKGNPYIVGASVWLNKEGWLDDPIPEKKGVEEVVLNTCICGENATILNPRPLCARCWNMEYGTIKYDGKTYRANEFLAVNLQRIGMTELDGETWGEYTGRCRTYVLDRAKSLGMVKKERV